MDDSGRAWIATAREEETPRHHGRWHLVFHPAGEETGPLLVMPEVQWQSWETAERTIRTISPVELRRRLAVVRARMPHYTPSGAGSAA
jgi:hypothetical protein